MKTIETRYVGPGNVRGSRIIASDGDNRVIIPYDHELNSEQAHMKAAQEFMTRMKWNGTLQGGHTKRGMVWVFMDGGLVFTIQ